MFSPSKVCHLGLINNFEQKLCHSPVKSIVPRKVRIDIDNDVSVVVLERTTVFVSVITARQVHSGLPLLTY